MFGLGNVLSWLQQDVELRLDLKARRDEMMRLAASYEAKARAEELAAKNSKPLTAS